MHLCLVLIYVGILRVFIVPDTHSTHEVRHKNITTGYEPKPQLGFIYSAVDLRVCNTKPVCCECKANCTLCTLLHAQVSLRECPKVRGSVSMSIHKFVTSVVI